MFSTNARAQATLAVLAICFPSGAIAQGVVGLSPEAPAPYSLREFGINLSTTDVTVQNDDISVGSGEFPTKLTLTRTYTAIGYPLRNLQNIAAQNQFTGFGQGSTHSILAYFTRQTCGNLGNVNGRFISLTAVVFGKSYHFSGGGCIASMPLSIVNDDEEGASLRIINPTQPVSTYELTTRDGMRAIFTDEASYKYDTISGRYAKFAEFPNGDFIVFDYTASPSVASTVRLNSAFNSRGYGFRFNYINRPPYFPNNTLTDSSLITSVTSVRKLANGELTLANAEYTYDAGRYFVTTFKNAEQGIYRYSYDIEGRPTKVFYPKGLADQPTLRLTYYDGNSQQIDTRITALSNFALMGLMRSSSGSFLGAGQIIAGVQDNVIDVNWSVPVSAVDALGNVTKFEFSDPAAPDPIGVVVTNPDGSSRSYTTVFCSTSPACPLAPFYIRSPSNVRDERSNQFNYSYDGHGRPLSSRLPSGLIRSVVRDSVGNVVEVRTKAPPAAGGADIVSSAGYVQCGPTNYRFCGKPSFTIDPRGARRDFQYDAANGMLVASLAPADASGFRAVTRYTYTAFGYGPVPAPAALNSSGIYLLTSKEECLSSTVAANAVDFTYSCTTGNRRKEVYGYRPSTSSVASSLEVMDLNPDADSDPSQLGFTYDNVGNQISVRDRKGNTSYSTYDSMRRKVFEIGSDPDGSGPLKRPIIQHFYDINGNEIRTESGFGSQIDGSDFVVSRLVRRTFDLNDKLVRSEDVIP
jgi:hypothetical protein